MKKDIQRKSGKKPRAFVVDMEATRAASDLSLTYDPGGLLHEIASKPSIGDQARADFERMIKQTAAPARPVAADLAK
ncbi:MAG: hypothetical protein GC159_02635 [Phycisphaera sp.]|nr:hypothetical protein [Phycisphaera sp.]